MFGARALVLKGVETHLWNPLPRLSVCYVKGLARPSIWSIRELSTVASPEKAPETKSAQLPPSPLVQYIPTAGGRRLERPRCFFRRWVKLSPSKALTNFQRLRGRGLRTRLSRKIHGIAEDRSNRLPFLTAQAVLRHMLDVEALDADTDKTLREALESRLQWRRRIAYLADKGLPEKRILHWAWILSSDDGDIMVHRFTNSREPRPLFLLLHILGKDKEFREKETFIALVSHIQKHYVRGKEPFSNYHRFAILVDQLIRKCLAFWPPMVVPVARLTAEYIKRIPLEPSRSRRTHGYRSRCVVFNKAIYALGLVPLVDRQTSREFCWEAQKILLECSSITTPHLTIDRKSYQSIREVLLGLNKTELETKVALRSAKTWPPYREAWDGTDERRRPEDDLSRSAKAGILMHEAGYQSTDLDEALTVLGGSFSGRRPTVQTKTLSIKHQKPHANAHAYTLWVSRMEATRNAREAWQVFQTPPTPGVAPPADVYAVMFEKLLAPPVTALDVVPGDTKKVFPVYNGNLSAFSIARLEPPRPKLLYAKMREQGLPPVGRCLAVLIRHADDIEEALDYLKESPYAWGASVLEKRAYDPLKYSPADLGAMRQKLSHIPVSIFTAWISTLCRLHSYHQSHHDCDTNIPDAIFLVRLYRPKSPLLGTTPMYRAITGALARNKVIQSKRGEAHNFAPTLSTFLGAFVQWRSTTQSADEQMFFHLCLVIRKAMRFMLFSQVNRGRTINSKTTLFSFMKEYGTLLHRFHQGVVFEFNELVKLTGSHKESCEKSGLVLPSVLVSLRPGSFMAYMQGLGLFGDTKEMVRLVDWIFDAYQSGGVLSTEWTTPGYHQDVVAALAYFDGMATEMIDLAELTRLKDRLEWLRSERGCIWSFPSEGGRDLRDVRYDLVCARLWRHVDIPSVKAGTPNLEESSSLQKEHAPVTEPCVQTTVPTEQTLDWKYISDQEDAIGTIEMETPWKKSKNNDIAIQEKDFLKLFKEGFSNEKSKVAKEGESKEDLLAVFDREVPWEVSPGNVMVVEEDFFLRTFKEDLSNEKQSAEKGENEDLLGIFNGEVPRNVSKRKDIVPEEDFMRIFEEELSRKKGQEVEGGRR